MSSDAASGAALVPVWPKIIRLTERWVITEKIDGTHAILVIRHAGAERTAEPGGMVAAGPGGRPVTVRAASRTRWLVPEHLAREGDGRDNFGFAAWVAAHAADLAALGPGDHHGEWYGQGIGRGYELTSRRFALFDTTRWQRGLPEGVPEELDLVPVPAECEGVKLNATVTRCLARLEKHGSQLVPGAAAEGIIASSTTDTRLALKAYSSNMNGQQ
ncbi:RNA ligase family protein [Glycomyces albidus]|uniref:RNA ligase family protein n=1 Tax=Glycomyces albidus TaxID=2656774 RepID=UPI001883B2BA|nr:RNA ligase family protein [Glycomyces albidus]